MKNEYLMELIKTTLSAIPEEKESLRTKLESIYDSVDFCSPEMVPFWFHETIKILRQNLSFNSPENWQQKVISLWRNRH